MACCGQRLWPRCSGVDHILHAGDVGDPAILDALAALAPLTAIRGNIDRTGLCASLPAAEIVDLGGSTIYMLHSLEDIDLDAAAAGFDIVISGHSHQPVIESRKGVLYLNPGKRRPATLLSSGFDCISAVGQRGTGR